MEKKTFYFIIFIQFIVILFIGFKIYKNNTDALGVTQVAPLNKENLTFIQSAELKNFYEPKPNTQYRNENPSIPNAGEYTINSDSLNERSDYEIKKPDNTFRIVTLGDSYTFGMYVDTDKNWPEKLEDTLNINKTCKKYKKFEVINLGMEGYDVQYSVERFKLRGIKYKPDLVLWLLKKDDFIQINELMLEKKKKYDISLKESGEYDELLKQGVSYPSWDKAMQESYAELGKENTKQLLIQNFDQFHSFYNKSLLIINFSHEPKDIKSFYKDVSNRYKNSRYFGELTSIYNDQKYYFENDSHPTVEGHELIANDIYKYIEENNIIPCE